MATVILAQLPRTTPSPGGAAAPAATSTLSDIHEIRGPIAIDSSNWGWWLLTLFSAIALAAIIYGIWRWRRSRRIALSIDGQALRRLEDARSLMRPERSREFADAVSEAVRQYLEARFSLAVTRQTTEEFLQELAQAPPPALAQRCHELNLFLQECDRAKFGQDLLTTAQMEPLLQSARELVVQTAEASSAPLKSSPTPSLS